MNDPKLKITLELSGQEKIEEFLAKLNKKYHLAADADFSNIAKEIQENIESPMNKQISALNSFKTKAMQFGLVMNGVSSAIRGAMMLYNATVRAVVDSAAEFEQLKLRLVSLYQDTDKAAAAFEKFRTIAANTPATLKGATKAAIGLSAAFGIDLATAMDLIGKAAAGNTSMLGRYGIVLDETSRQIVEASSRRFLINLRSTPQLSTLNSQLSTLSNLRSTPTLNSQLSTLNSQLKRSPHVFSHPSSQNSARK